MNTKPTGEKFDDPRRMFFPRPEAQALMAAQTAGRCPGDGEGRKLTPAKKRDAGGVL